MPRSGLDAPERARAVGVKTKDVERTGKPAVSMSPIGGDEARELGAALRDTRIAHRRELADVAAELRIRENYLRAIEDGRLSDLPGTTYAFGFVRAYAEYLGLDAREMARRFREAAGGGTGQLNLVLPSPVAEGRLPTGAVLLVAAIIALGAYGGWYYLSTQGRDAGAMIAALPDRIEALIHRESAPDATEPAPAPVQAAPAPAVAAAAPQPAAQPAAAPAATGTPASHGAVSIPLTPTPTTPAPTTQTAAAPPEAAPAPAAPTPAPAETAAAPETPAAPKAEEDAAPPPPEPLGGQAASDGAAAEEAAPAAATPAPSPAPAVASTAPPAAPAQPLGVTVEALPPRPPARAAATPVPSAVPPAPAAAPTVTAAVPPPPPPAPPATSPHDIVLIARADSWVELRGADGQRIYSRVLRAGERYDVPDQRGLTMMTGNAGGLEIIVDGKPAPSLGEPGAVRRDIPLDPVRLLAGTAVPPQP